MQYLKQKVRNRFILALILSVALPGGILMTIFGATKGMTWMLVVGIVCIVAGF